MTGGPAEAQTAPPKPLEHSPDPEVCALMACLFEVSAAAALPIRLEAVDNLATELVGPDFVKVDIQGAKPLFFGGARRTVARHLPTMVVKYWEARYADALRAPGAVHPI